MLQDKVLQTIDKYGMFSSGDTVVVAVSGGADSVVLLHILHSLKDRLGISLYVAHMNHGIRGEAADQDAEFVDNLTRSLGLPCVIRKVDVPSLRKNWNMGTEEAARKARYGFLNEIADRTGAAAIATAHTASDQAETVLMNILRGSGIEGLGGMPAVRELIVRPMIEVYRSDVEAYAKQNNLSHREDATNAELTYTRNRIRHELLPKLESFNPKVDEALVRLAETARTDNDFIQQSTAQAFSELAERTENVVSFPLPRFISLHKSIQRRLIRAAVNQLMGSIVDIGFIHIENLLSNLEVPGVYEVELPPGTARVRKTLHNVSVYIVRAEEESLQITPRTIEIPGETEVPELGIKIHAEVEKGPVEYRRPRESMDVVIDAGKVTGMLIVRAWLPGDRMVPLGMKNPKKLQDLFVDRKIPRSERGRIPVVADEEKIVWIVGTALSE